MSTDLNPYVCRVCGLLLDFPPWGLKGDDPSFDFCPCCGVEFGFEDDTYESTKQYRLKWLMDGAKWSEPSRQPHIWYLAEQLSNVIYDQEVLKRVLSQVNL